MLNLYNFVCLFGIFVGVFVFCLKCSHLLLILLSLEFIVLFLYFMLYIYICRIGSDFYFGILFLTITVCEGTLGLSILISIIRSFGNDYFQSFNIL